MKKHTLSLSLGLALSLGPTLAHAAGSPARDVKVCVRIEEKSWMIDGARAPGPAGAAPAAPGMQVPPTNVPAPPLAQSPEPPPPSAAFASAGAPTLLPEAPDVAPPPARMPAAVVSPQPGHGGEDGVDESEADFFSVDPKMYLRRLVEYHVTHEPGFESVHDGCSQTITVELYPVRHGWTVFARYSGNAREEKIDVVRLDELGTFAERATAALLRDKTIVETLTRTTVLRADSEPRVREIEAHPHLLLGMGSDFRIGRLPTAPNDTGAAVDQLRVETPLSFTVGARNKFRGWALDATGRMDFGLVQLASRHNQGGGHASFAVGMGLGLGFLAYADPDAVNTFYYGGGGSFQLTRYQTLGALSGRNAPAPDGLWGGGLNIDAILGYEFMRTSTLHFFVQGTVSAPAYVFESENEQSRIHSYIPSANFQVGLLF